MFRLLTTRVKLFPLVFIALAGGSSCKDDDTIPTDNKPRADFIFTIENQGLLPDTVNFESTATNATSLRWYFGNGATSSDANPQVVYTKTGTYEVKLIVSNQYGTDSITKPVSLRLDRPVADFTFTLSDAELLPVTLTTINTTIGSNVTYTWTFENSTSSETHLKHSFTVGGNYDITLLATNASGSHSVTKKIRITPYPQVYTSFNGNPLNLFAWEGNKVMILSRNGNLSRATMFKWLHAMDAAYDYYKACTGKEPFSHTPNYYLNNRATIADATSTCGAGCGYLGLTGIELQSLYFDINYNGINTSNAFDHLCFYEFGRNFWFYGSKLDYKEPGSFPIAGAFAVWMGSIEGRDAIGVSGDVTYAPGKVKFANYLNLYLASPNLNWANTLAVDKGVPGHCNAADLFTSMCMHLKKEHGGENFLKNIWKNVGLRSDAKTTQDAVDNFFLASCVTANKNLTTLFQSWRWPLSAGAMQAAAGYP